MPARSRGGPRLVGAQQQQQQQQQQEEGLVGGRPTNWARGSPRRAARASPAGCWPGQPCDALRLLAGLATAWRPRWDGLAAPRRWRLTTTVMPSVVAVAMGASIQATLRVRSTGACVCAVVKSLPPRRAVRTAHVSAALSAIASTMCPYTVQVGQTARPYQLNHAIEVVQAAGCATRRFAGWLASQALALATERRAMT
eukprot:scaffold495_cov405-Prasinococcus_capsulatus_cf.AAC.14